jgi:Tfp pilus assembly protein FimT
MLLVIVIITILAGGAVVSLRGRKDSFALQASTNDLASALRFAAVQAKLEQTMYRLIFNDGMKTYHVEKNASGATQEFVPVRGLAGHTKSLTEGVRLVRVLRQDSEINPMPRFLEFDKEGGGFCGKIELQNRYGESTQIEVMSKTGQVYVLE